MKSLKINTSWLNGKYPEIAPDAEINTRLSYVSCGGFFIQGDEAEEAIEEMSLMWESHPAQTQTDVFHNWANKYGLVD